MSISEDVSAWMAGVAKGLALESLVRKAYVAGFRASSNNHNGEFLLEESGTTVAKLSDS